MANLILPPAWKIADREATPEAVYVNRRTLLKGLGFAAGAIAGSALLPAQADARSLDSLKQELAALPPLAAQRNPAFVVEDPLTPIEVAARYNNFYEFTTDKDVWEEIEQFKPRPWTLEVAGLVEHPRTYDVDDLIKRMPVEERVYRHRCVEAWSMVVPWVGFPLRALLKEAGPKYGSQYVKFTSFLRPEEAQRQGRRSFFGAPEPFPYTEGLTLAEATNELTLLTVGMYGRILARQHGAPIRLTAPWKYGFKQAKSIVKIELVAEQPPTFWNQLVPREYGFEANVEPQVPHPRWSQAYEEDIGTRRRKPTLYLNGYAQQVGALYKKA
jgi:sulfoxide reductase catalytic subunit YedY